jgi:hypothetical protein
MAAKKHWQIEIVANALALKQITEDQALLLGMLYYHADWSTRVLSDFRAERACEWLGHDLGYTRSMQRRLQTLRDMGWFTWTYKPGVKVPYDITMRAEYCGELEGGAPPTVGDRHEITVCASPTAGDGVESPVEILNLSSIKVLNDKTQATLGDGGAPPPHLVALRAAIYAATEGEMLDRLLTPSQIRVLLDAHTVAEIVFAVRQRREKISDRREFHRSFGWFLRDGGIKIELDAERELLQAQFEYQNNRYMKWANGKSAPETPEQMAERRQTWIERNESALGVFPEIAKKVEEMMASTQR